MRFTKLSLLLLALAVLTIPSFANNLLADGSFESPMVPSTSTCGAYGAPGSAECFHTYPAYSNSVIGPWYVIGKSDINPDGTPNNGPAPIMLMTNTYSEPYFVSGVQTGTLSFTPEDGSQAIDLTGDGNQGENGIKQTVLGLSPGTYDLTFWLGREDSHADGYTGGPASVQLWINGNPASGPGCASVYNNGFGGSADINWHEFSCQFAASGDTTIAFLNNTALGNNYAGLDNVVLTQTPEPASLVLLGSGLVGLFGLKLRRN